MIPIVFSLFNNLNFAEAIKDTCNYEMGEISIRFFPDEEIYIKINSNVKNREVLFVASLDRPNSKFLSLIFAAETARDLGAKKITLVAPYLAYMRQDKRFNPGEGITSKYFATLLSNHFDCLITIDPHLHRRHSLTEIYKKSNLVLHAEEKISAWIKQYVKQPIIIGPDKESEQWVSKVAQNIQAPFLILEKHRKGDSLVEVSVPKLEQHQGYTPVLLDDIIATAKTMIEVVKHLKDKGMRKPICIGIHAIFAGNAYTALLEAGADKIITCNTVTHPSNAIDLSELIANAIKNGLSS